MSRRPPFRLPREHSEALLLARRLQRSDSATAAADRRQLLRFWYGSGAAHLRAEEHVLLEAWTRHGGADHPLAASIRAEQARLSDAVAAVAETALPAPCALREIGRALAAHVARHERELAGVVELTLPPDELAAVRDELDGLRSRQRIGARS